LAIVATGGQRTRFPKRRQFAAWLGLTPRQHSFRRQEPPWGYLPNTATGICAPCFILGARSVLHTAARHTDRMSRWVMSLEQRRGYQRTLVAIASKNARIAWALLSRTKSCA